MECEAVDKDFARNYLQRSRTMKLHYAIPVALGILALTAYQARAVDPARPNAPGAEVKAPGVDVRAGAAGVNVATPNVGVDVKAPAAPIVRAPAVPVQSGPRPAVSAFTDNRPDQWRYKLFNNRWWYWAPDNRWMSYSDPGGWTYVAPSGSYTTGYGGVPVAPEAGHVVPPTTYYYYPNSGYYYGYPGGYYYYGRPGVYIGGRGWGRGRWW